MAHVPNYYDKGDTVSLNALYYNKLGVLSDPSSAILKVIDPLGNQTMYTPTKDSIGIYHYDLATDLTDPSGYWQYRFEGTGAITSAEEFQFVLRETDFT